MDRPRRYASLLLITASQETAVQFARFLPAERFAPEFSVCLPLEARHALEEASFDVAVIDESVPFASVPALVHTAAERGIQNILLIAGADRIEQAASFAQEHSVMALQSPVAPDLLRQSLGMMAVSSARIHDLQEKAPDLQEKMDELRLVNRAKLILMQRFQMTEKDAHRFIEKNAMDRCEKRRSIAESIIRTYQN